MSNFAPKSLFLIKILNNFQIVGESFELKPRATSRAVMDTRDFKMPIRDHAPCELFGDDVVSHYAHKLDAHQQNRFVKIAGNVVQKC